MMDKLKVMYILPNLDIGGSERKVVDIVKTLNKELFDPIVCCVTEGGVLKEELDEASIKTYICHKSSKFDVFVVKRICRILKKENVQIVHTFVSTGKLWGRLSAILAKTNVIISTEESLFRPSKSAILFEKMFSRYTDVIITNSIESKLSAQKYTNLPDSKYQVIYNGINLTHYDNVDINIETKKKALGLNLDDYVITCVARFDKRKGHKYLLEAFAKLSNSNSDLKLLLVGDGKEKENLTNICKSLNIQDQVIFTGIRNDVNEILKISDLFVLPSIEEGFGNVIVEAMVSKVLTIATRVGGIPEIITHKHNGLLIDKENSEDLFSMLEYAICNEDLVKQMINVAYVEVFAKFDINNIIKQIEDLYINLYNKKVKK